MKSSTTIKKNGRIGFIKKLITLEEQ